MGRSDHKLSPQMANNDALTEKDGWDSHIHTFHLVPRNSALRRNLPYHPRRQPSALEFIRILPKSEQTETVQRLCSGLEDF